MNARFLKIARCSLLTTSSLIIAGCGGGDDASAPQTGTVVSSQGVTGGNCASLFNLQMVATTC